MPKIRKQSAADFYRGLAIESHRSILESKDFESSLTAKKPPRRLKKIDSSHNIDTTFEHISHVSAWSVIMSCLQIREWARHHLKQIREAKAAKQRQENAKFVSRMSVIVQENPVKAMKIVGTCMMFGWRLKLLARIARKRVAADCATNFLREYIRFKVPVFIHRYRFNAVKLQRYIRNYQAVTATRLHVLCILWKRLEKRFTSKQLPKLLMQAEEKRMRALLTRPIAAKAAGDNLIGNPGNAYFPRLVQGVHDATNKLNELNYALVRTKLLVDRFPMRIICKPVSSKTREQAFVRMQAVETFLRDIREEYKVANLTTKVVHHKSVVATLEDAKDLLRRKKGNYTSEGGKVVCMRMNFLYVYSGEPRALLVRRMEALVRSEHGLPTVTT